MWLDLTFVSLEPYKITLDQFSRKDQLLPSSNVQTNKCQKNCMKRFSTVAKKLNFGLKNVSCGKVKGHFYYQLLNLSLNFFILPLLLLLLLWGSYMLSQAQLTKLPPPQKYFFGLKSASDILEKNISSGW